MFIKKQNNLDFWLFKFEGNVKLVVEEKLKKGSLFGLNFIFQSFLPLKIELG
jgi:hypothetical protein